MKIVTPADNGPRAHQSGQGFSMHDNRRRHDFITRRVAYAREAGIIEAALPADSKSKVANAARALVQSYQLGKVSRQQIEEEQRADETRLKGWELVKPQPGTIHAEEIPKIKYRMAVRARALEEIASLDLAVMISPTGRDQHGLPKPPVAKPWRAGTGYGSSGAKKGKPIGLREYNHCHVPAGSSNGGQFGSGDDCGGGGSEGGGGSKKEPPAVGSEKHLQYANDRVNRVMDYFDKSRGPIRLKAENQGAVNRALDAANNPIKDEGTSQNPNAWKNKSAFNQAVRYEDDTEYAAPPGSKFARKALVPPDFPPMPHDVDTDDYGEPNAKSGGSKLAPPGGIRRRNDFQQAMRDETQTFGGKPDPGGVRNAAFEKKQAEWRAESARLEQKHGTDDGRGPIDEYKGVPIYTLGTYTTPYYYVARKNAPASFRNKVGSVNHTTSFARIRRLIDGIKKATG